MCALQMVLTVGTIVLGLFVASRVLGVEGGGKPGQPKGGRGRGAGKWGSGRCVSLTLLACRAVSIHVSFALQVVEGIAASAH